MKYIIFLIVILIGLQSCNKEEEVKAPDQASTKNSLLAANSWERKVDYPGVGRIDVISFTIGSKGYMGGGYDYGDFWEYNPQTNQWTRKADLPGDKRRTPFAFSIGSKGYIGRWVPCIGPKNFAIHVYEYNPETDSWLRKADYPGSSDYGVASFSTERFGYVGCGMLLYYDDDPDDEEQYHYDRSEQKDFWKFNPETNKWSRIADFGGGKRSFGVGFSIGNDGFVGFGSSNAPQINPHKDLWEYSEALNTWIRKADLPGTPREFLVAFGLNQKGYIGTGGTGEYSGPPSHLSDFWEYDPSTNIWTRKADFPGGNRQHSSGFAVNGKAYLGLGMPDAFAPLKNDFWEYSPGY
ncbi:MAG: type sorting protein [Sphingobacteriales bacterium]|nr:type sorting protein [Sphingobacteriales bacterium]